MKQCILILLNLISYSFQINGQCLKAVVIDDSNEPLAFANIYLKQDNNVILETMSDLQGHFDLCPENKDMMLLVIEYIGKIMLEETIDFSKLDTEEIQHFVLLDDPNLTILACPTITYNRTFEDSNVEFKRKEFELMAGAYEDPARLILKYPGYAISNDQANGIINMGMAPAFTKWSLNGIEIVNPNHLSNAGTLSDLSSASAGGVNALSGNIMERFSYLSNPIGSAYANALAAFADVRTEEEQQNYLSLGLLGMETGWKFGIREKGPTLNVNYRYSFVGLLSALGVDFGGESIAFQDLFIQSYLMPSGSNHQFSFHYLFGTNKNDHQAITEEIESTVFKDISEIQFDGRLHLLGMHYEWKDYFGLNDLNFHVSYSFKDDNREAQISAPFIDSYPGFYNYSILEEKVLQAKLNSTFNIGKAVFDGGIVYTYLAQNQTLQKNIIQAFAMDEKMHQARAYFQFDLADYQNYSSSIGVNILHDRFTDESLLEPYFDYKKYLSPSVFARLGFSKNSQSPFLNHIAMAGENQVKRMKSHAFHIQMAHIFGVGFNLIGNFLYDIPEAQTLFYHGYNEFSFEENIDLNYSGKARNFGISTYAQKNFGLHKSLGLQGNFSLLESQYQWENEWFDGKYNVNYTFNFSISKSFGTIYSTGWTGNINIAFHQRGGVYSNLIDLATSEKVYFTQLDFSKPYEDRAKAYQRVDFRVILQKDLRTKFIRKQIISLDIQNLLNKENEGFYYFDHFTEEVRSQAQLGMIPVVSYKLIFGKG